MTEKRAQAAPPASYGNSRPRTFPWSHLLLRAVWNVVWLVLASWTPPPLHGWRRMLLRAFGAHIASDARVSGSARIWYPPNLVMGPGAVLGWRAHCYSMARIEIGAHATVSQYAQLCAGTHDTESAEFTLFERPITIGPHAWTAANAFVGPGVTVGEGAVLGACAVAARSLEPWSIYVGNPAKLLRPRRNFTDLGAVAR